MASSMVGMMALMDVPQYAGEWPQICMIRSEEDNTVNWYGGASPPRGNPVNKSSTRRWSEKRGRKVNDVRKHPKTCQGNY